MPETISPMTWVRAATRPRSTMRPGNGWPRRRALRYPIPASRLHDSVRRIGGIVVQSTRQLLESGVDSRRFAVWRFPGTAWDAFRGCRGRCFASQRDWSDRRAGAQAARVFKATRSGTWYRKTATAFGRTLHGLQDPLVSRLRTGDVRVHRQGARTWTTSLPLTGAWPRTIPTLGCGA